MEDVTMNKISRVGVLGAGNAGQAFAGWLSSLGCEVRITDLFPEPVSRLSTVKEIELLGRINGKGRVQIVPDPGTCVENADLIILATAAPGHRAIIEKSASGLRDGQILMVQPAYWAHRTIPHYLKQLGIHRRLIYVQTESLIYTCRSVEPGKVMINYVKNGMG
jgi:opine dehydrogenase